MIAVAIIAALAFFVQAFTGFGAALILAPLLALVVDLKLGVVASAIVQIPVGAWLTYRARRAVAPAFLWRLVPVGVLGLAAGTYALAALDVVWLKRLCGLITVVFAAEMLQRTLRRVQARPWPGWAGHVAGLLGGLLGGLFGTSGPPVVAYLERNLERGAALRATLLAYFLAINTLRLLSYGAASLYTAQVVALAATMLPAAAVGAWCGAALQRRATEGGFRLVVAAVLLVTGLALALR